MVKMRVLIFLYLFITTINVNAEELTLPSGQELVIQESGDENSQYHAIWLHSERGLSAPLTELIKNTSKTTHIIMPNLHESYFLSSGKSSLDQIPKTDIDDLIRHYSKLYPRLYIIGHSRASELILNATRRLQLSDHIKFPGLIFISPYLQKEVPEVGQKVEYLDTVHNSNLPIYIFQPQRSTRFVPVKGLVEALQVGGSEVYLHPLLNVGGGYQTRSKEHWEDGDAKAREDFPQQLDKAFAVLAMTDPAPIKAFKPEEKAARKVLDAKLRQVEMVAPALALNDLNGKAHKLSDYKDKIVIVSFWASWCRPCLEEMPSLVALKKKYKDKLEILAVNILEEKATIEKFTNPMKINFPILQDKDSKTVTAWKVYVYPSNYILDQTGTLRYAVTGAIDWQAQDVADILDKL